MPEIGTSGSMSGERKRSDGSQSEPQATAPLLDSTYPPLHGVGGSGLHQQGCHYVCCWKQTSD